VTIYDLNARQAEPEPPDTRVYLHCGICTAKWPQGESHTCRLSPRQKRRLEAAQREQAMMLARLAHEEPRKCPACREMVEPRTTHSCPGPPEAKLADAAHADAIAALLRRNGYRVERAEP